MTIGLLTPVARWLLQRDHGPCHYQNNGWHVPPDPFFNTIWRILKPGGALGVIDHRAPGGSGNSYARNLHRIDPEFARQDIESRGFEQVAESSLLDNPADRLSKSVFDPAIRGRTARFLHRYVKVQRTAGEEPLRTPDPE
jgi:predicted methyltransferase